MGPSAFCLRRVASGWRRWRSRWARRHAQSVRRGICPRTFPGRACRRTIRCRRRRPSSAGISSTTRGCRETDAVVRHVSRAGARVHRRPGARGRVDRRGASARQHEPGQRRLRGGADVGEPGDHAARRSGAGADVRRASDRARPAEAGRGTAGRLRREPRYQPLFARAFGAEPDPFSLEHVTQALATFERTIMSARRPTIAITTSATTRAIPPAARRGETLFFSQPLSCFRCHGGFTFSGAVDFEGRRERARSSFTTPGCTTSPARSRIRPEHRDVRDHPEGRRTSASSRRRRSATSPSPRRTCTTAASRRSRT